MKMGTIASPCLYDAAARHALQSPSLRRPAILPYASWAAAGVRLLFDSGHAGSSRIDVMGQQRTSLRLRSEEEK